MSPTEMLRTERLTLTPLAVGDAPEMSGVLADAALYFLTGGSPPTEAELEELYRFQLGDSPRAGETWHNWVLRLGDVAVGYGQATVEGDHAELAWVIGVPWQGCGYATEAAMAMRTWLTQSGVASFSAHIHPDHVASQRVAVKIGLVPSGEHDDEGEMIWV